ncbi:MAG TPA: TlpA disulfide reductase family protein [Bacteroidales bacterium]|nr:TlpA disulfide reductase family protein [Bacteroidales bacterium]
MKKTAYLLIIALSFVACSSEPHYVITGKIDGADSITFLLQQRVAGKIVTIDSALALKGSFKMKGGVIEYPDMVQLLASGRGMRTSFYLENSEITITGTLDSLFNATVTGSKTQDEYQAFIASNKPLSERYSKVYTEYQTANQNGDNARVAELEKEAEVIQKEMTALQKDFIKNNPASFVAPSLLRSLSYELEATEIESYINAMDTNVAKIPIIRDMKERVTLMKTVAIGQKAPDFTMNDIEGNPVSLSSKIGSKLLLVDFWAAWCGPCRQENPNVVKVYKEFSKKGFDVFGVSLDQKKEDWLKGIADDKLTWTHVSDLQYWNNAAAKIYAVNSIPANFLLDENGVIIARNLRGEALYNRVNETLGGIK